MLSEQKMSMKLLMIGAVLLIAAVKGESPSLPLSHYVIEIFLAQPHLPLFVIFVTQCLKIRAVYGFVCWPNVLITEGE